MKALLTLGFTAKRNVLTVALVSLVFWTYPEATIIASSMQPKGQSALVFEIKDPSLAQNTDETPTSLTYQEIVESDPLVTKLENYLQKHNSPLAEYSSEIIKQPQWQRALAISWVESNFGRRCADNNCSGIGVAPGHPSWRKYPTKLEWFKDMSLLLEKPIYKEKYTTFEKMRGVYVQPGSAAWVYGAKTKYAELMELEKQAIEEKQLAMQNTSIPVTAASAETPQLAKMQ